MALKAKVKRTDLQILDALLEKAPRARLSEADDKAFVSMRDRLLQGKQINLSSKQREWVERRYWDLELDAEEAPDAVEVPSGTKPLPENLFGPMVLKPPGRR